MHDWSVRILVRKIANIVGKEAGRSQLNCVIASFSFCFVVSKKLMCFMCFP